MLKLVSENDRPDPKPHDMDREPRPYAVFGHHPDGSIFAGTMAVMPTPGVSSADNFRTFFDMVAGSTKGLLIVVGPDAELGK
jgi:hypothetical protein